MLVDAMPTRDRLARCLGMTSHEYSLCGLAREMTVHLHPLCPVLSGVWWGSPWQIHTLGGAGPQLMRLSSG